MDKILIWGTGKKAHKLTEHLIKGIDVLAYIETVPSKEEFRGKKVICPEEIDEYCFEKLIISMLHPVDALKVAKAFVDKKKIVCLYLEDFHNIEDILSGYEGLLDIKDIVKKDYYSDLILPYDEILPHIAEFMRDHTVFDIM